MCIRDRYEPGELDARALIAGNDILLCAEDVPRALKMIKKSIKDGLISEDEINQKCKKILLAKKWMGLDNFESINLKIIHDSLVTKSTERINQKLIKSSVTLLQNYDSLLPLKRLDTLKIASLTIGEKSIDFQQALNYYAKVDTFSISEDANIKSQAYILDK